MLDTFRDGVKAATGFLMVGKKVVLAYEPFATNQ